MTFFFYDGTTDNLTFISQQYAIIGAYGGIIAVYVLAKLLLYVVVNGVFFTTRLNVEWMRNVLFLMAMEGVFMFPAVALQAYFDMPPHNVFVYSLIIVALVKMVTFYKSFTIFFSRKDGLLQNILYFCALEIVPLASLWGVLVAASELLTVTI